MEFLRKKNLFLAVMLSLAVICAQLAPAFAADSGETAIVLSDAGVTVNGQDASSDPSDTVYLSHDIIYYEDRDTWDNGNPYGEGTASQRHSAGEAAAHTVVNITRPGIYRLSGKLSLGQIFVNIDKSKRDSGAVVTLILDNVDITCTVAPAIFFYNVYECDQAWTAYDDGETEAYTPSAVQDTSAAGANVIIADGSVNNITGSHVARIYKEDGSLKSDGTHKKLHKYDGAFYSRRSMNITGGTAGTGILNITADNEGLDSELHMTINGGKINIQAQNDGINTNEDNVSAFTMNGGALHIVAGLGAEGDGIDSNGYLTINGGVVISIAKPQSDSGLDSDCGSSVNGGYVVATGSTMDWAESSSKQVTMNLQFASSQGADEAILITDLNGKAVFAYDPDKDETTGSYNRGYRGAIISCPELQQGESYHVYVGGDVYGLDVDGLYDAAFVTGFTGAYRQQYTGTSVGFGPGGGRPGGMRPGNAPEMPDGMPPGEPPELPNGMKPGEAPEMPDGMEPGQRPDRPGDMGGRPGFPDGTEWGGTPNGPDGIGPGQQSGSGEASNLFYMAETVNAFSGVADEAGGPVDMGVPSDTEPEVSAFDDVDSGAYYYAPVLWAVERGITIGTSDTTFSPDAACTRAQIITFLWRAAGSPEPQSSENPFDDVGAADFYWKAALWAYEKGLVAGTSFSASADCTRASTVQYLWQAAGGPAAAAGTGFSDVASDAEYAQAVAWAVEQGVTAGTSSTTFSPDMVCTRGQIAAFLYRAFAE